MRSKSKWAMGLFWVAIALSACAKAPRKFQLDRPHRENQLILTLKATENFFDSTVTGGLRNADSEIINARSMLLKFPSSDTIDLQDLGETLMADDRIQAVESNQIYRLDELLPNDPDFAKLYALRNTGADGGVTGADIGVTKAWELSTGSKSVLVGIIDSGTDYNHPDLAENIWQNPAENGLDANGKDKQSNDVDDDGNGFVDDWHGWDFFNNDNNPMDDNSHGSHVAGTIGGRGNNGIGVVGVNWVVSMVPIKVFSASGESSTDVLLKGIDYATTLGVVASNNSWGGGGSSVAMSTAIQRAGEKGILFVAAAGNDGVSNDSSPHYPSSYDLPNIISVAATDRKDVVASFSNFGSRSVHVAAPGTDIWSTTPNNSYGLKSGTSMATPHVTGLLALVKAKFPEFAASELKAKVLASASPVSRLLSKVQYGRLDAAGALETDLIPPGMIQNIKIETLGIKDLSLSWREAGDDGELGQASRYELRLSSSPILDEVEWAAAEKMNLSEIVRKDGLLTASISDLSYNQQSYLTMRAMDNVGNIGGMAASVNFTLLPVQILLADGGDTLEIWQKLDSPWGLAVQGVMNFLSDSPIGKYENNLNITAETKDLTFTDSNLVLDLRCRYDLESNFDFAAVEVSTDHGASYQELGKFTGTRDWSTLSFNLKDVLRGASVFRIRLRMKTDYSVAYEGWDIDSLQIVGRQL